MVLMSVVMMVACQHHKTLVSVCVFLCFFVLQLRISAKSISLVALCCSVELCVSFLFRCQRGRCCLRICVCREVCFRTCEEVTAGLGSWKTNKKGEEVEAQTGKKGKKEVYSGENPLSIEKTKTSRATLEQRVRQLLIVRRQ